MEDQAPGPNSPNQGSEKNEPVRSRWTPKPEQILILESIFNSGMVNPPKDETVRIRKLLEKFGAVGDANVFYWFQNRRSRSRRRQRQMQAAGASLAAGEQRSYNQSQLFGGGGGAIDQYEGSGVSLGFANSPSNFASLLVGPSSSYGGVMSDDGVENLVSISSPQMGFQETGQSSTNNITTSNLQYQSGFMTVFINGVPSEVPRGPLDIKAMFGEDVVLVHSSGVPLPINDFGILLETLLPGESYFLVSRTN